jgi:hypothetical protein
MSKPNEINISASTASESSNATKEDDMDETLKPEMDIDASTDSNAKQRGRPPLFCESRQEL